MLFVRLFDLRLFGFVCFLFLLVSGKGCGEKAPNSLSASKRKHKNQNNHYDKYRRVLMANSVVCQSNRVSDFRDFVCSLFPKEILFDFYFSPLQPLGQFSSTSCGAFY